MVSLESINECSKYLNYSLIKLVSKQKLLQLLKGCLYIGIRLVLRYLLNQNDPRWFTP